MFGLGFCGVVDVGKRVNEDDIMETVDIKEGKINFMYSGYRFVFALLSVKDDIVRIR